MNNNWQHTIQNHTEIPPEGIWDRIANELDTLTILQQKILTHTEIPPSNNWDIIENKLDAQQDATLQHLQAIEITPPTNIWNKINDELNQQSNWKQKIQQAEITPPPAIWDAINTSLNNENDTWQQKITNIEITPPPANWQHIANTLNANEKVVSITANHKKVVPFSIKMAAAAAVLIGIALYSLQLNKTQPLPQQQVAAVPQQINVQLKDTILSTANTNVALQPINNTLTVLPTKHTEKGIISIDTNYNKTLLLATVTEIELSNPADHFNTKLTNTNGELTNDIALLNAPNNYINITGPNGDQIKVSAKFSKLVNLLKERDTSKTEYLDKIIKEGAVWKMKFKTWREKMNTSNIAPTPANFMNIIELSKILKENK